MNNNFPSTIWNFFENLTSSYTSGRGQTTSNTHNNCLLKNSFRNLFSFIRICKHLCPCSSSHTTCHICSNYNSNSCRCTGASSNSSPSNWNRSSYSSTSSTYWALYTPSFIIEFFLIFIKCLLCCRYRSWHPCPKNDATSYHSNRSTYNHQSNTCSCCCCTCSSSYCHILFLFFLVLNNSF